MSALVVIDKDDLAQIVEAAVQRAISAKADPVWLSVPDYAGHVNRSVRTVQRYIEKGRLETREICGQVQVRVA